MTGDKSGPDHRASERVTLALEIHYRSAGAFLMSYSVNLSRGGLFIETNTPLPRGTKIELKLNTPDEESLDLTGHVAWVRASGDPETGQPPGMGIEVATPEHRYGPLVDRMVSRFHGLRIALAIGPGHIRARAMLHRHLAAVVSCEVIDFDDPFASIESGRFDLGIVSLDWFHGEQMVASLIAAAQIPVIVLARTPEMRANAGRLGADVALESPPGFPDLRAAVINTLARPQAFGSGKTPLP